MVILFLGPSGSGKDTQAQILAVKSSFQNISTGDLFRDLSNGASTIETYIKKAMNDGWINDYLTYGLLQVYMKYARGIDFILNGGVRRASQIGLLDTMLKDVGQKVDHVFNFEAPDEILRKRLSNRLYCKVCKSNYNTETNPPRHPDKCDRCGAILFAREDDNAKTIEIRLSEFRKYNKDIIAEYENRGIVTHVDATGTIDQIHLVINEKVHKLLDIEHERSKENNA